MAKKYVQITGLHNIFDSLDDLKNGVFKTSVSDIVDEYSIIFGVCDSEDETLFKSPYVNGSTLVYTRGLTYFVSGSFVKTVNSVGPDSNGNVNVSGSGGSSDIPVINKGTSDTTFTIEPNKIYVWDEVSSLDITLGAGSSGVANHYFFQFTSGSTATTLALPDTIMYIGSNKIEKNKKYQVSILNDIAVLGGATFATVKAIVDFNVTTDIGTTTSSTTDEKTYTVTDDLGETHAVSLTGSSSWSVSTASYTYTINGTSYNANYQLYFGGSSRYIEIEVTGPCTIYMVARKSSSSSRYMYASVGGTSIGTYTLSTSVTTYTGTYSGTGGTLSINLSGSAYLFHVEIDYNV